MDDTPKGEGGGRGEGGGQMKVQRSAHSPVALGFALLTAAGGAHAGEETRVAVWGFSAAPDDARGASLGQRLAILTEAELARRGCDIVERRGIERVLKEHKLAFTQFADAKKAVHAGRLVRADIVLVGTVLKRGKGRLVTMKAVETASGKVLDARALLS